MKRALALTLALVMCLALLPMTVLAAEDESTVTVSTLVEPKYEDAKAFSGGYAAVKQNGKWGYIDETGKMVIEPKYDYAGSFSEGIAVVANEGTLIYDEGTEWERRSTVYYLSILYTDGREVQLMADTLVWSDEAYGEYGGWVEASRPVYVYDLDDAAQWFYQEGVLVMGSYVFDANGREIKVTSGWEKIKAYDLNPEWGESYDAYLPCGTPCVNGLIPMYACGSFVSMPVLCFLMDKTGAVVQVFPREVAVDQWGWEEYYGTIWISAPESDRIVAEWMDYDPNTREYSYGIGAMDLNGNWVIKPVYDGYRYFYNGTFFSDGLWVVERNGKYGAVNVNGGVVIPFEYDFLAGFSAGLSGASKNGEFFYIDTFNNRYDVALPGGGIAKNILIGSYFNGDIAAVYDADTGKAYCITDTPVNGVLPAIEGTENIALSAYFPGFDGSLDSIDTIRGMSDIVVIEQDGKYGYLKLDFDLKNVNPFDDILPGAYYFDPVLWAVNNGITTGTDPGLFSPEETCTRAQIATFLWRAFGEPEPASTVSPFNDVTDPNEYYYKAVLWAAEQGITTGTDPGVFAPEEECTREQIVTFLWRAFGELEPASTVSPFNDVTDPNEYYYKAVLWAVEQEITTGTDPGVFSPEEECTRAQIVTFLYRALA